ncbi:MAG: hypothetical protein ABSG41_09335 [Bryobacteraceae bacterium]|jgi:hypothetical protein
MKVIDPDGLFAGDRFKDVTDEARLYWPFFWCASNGYGRIELNPHKVIGRAFAAFRIPLTEERFWSLIAEYQEAFLLFVYESAGQPWGQWATSEKYLSRHKRFEDTQSPAPNTVDFDAWRDAYISKKRAKSNSGNVRGNIAEKLLQRSREISAPIVLEERCIEVSCKNKRASDDAHVGSLSSIDDPPFESLPVNGLLPAKPAKVHQASSNKLSPERESQFAQFWGEYWTHKAKQESKAAFAKHVTAPLFERVLAAVRAQKREMLEREPQKRPYAATWLNGRRWEDELIEPGAKPATPEHFFSDLPEIRPARIPEEAA